MIDTCGQSVCTCGHVGDVPSRSDRPTKANDHIGLLGHGKCQVPTCKCDRFTWARFVTKEEAR
jgi:hypothetical protein